LARNITHALSLFFLPSSNTTAFRRRRLACPEPLVVLPSLGSQHHRQSLGRDSGNDRPRPRRGAG
jgi:hypothetical protein